MIALNRSSEATILNTAFKCGVQKTGSEIHVWLSIMNNNIQSLNIILVNGYMNNKPHTFACWWGRLRVPKSQNRVTRSNTIKKLVLKKPLNDVWFIKRADYNRHITSLLNMSETLKYGSKFRFNLHLLDIILLCRR